MLARKGVGKSCMMPARIPPFQDDLKFYNHRVHSAAFVLPHFVRDQLKNLNQQNMDNDEATEDCFLSGCQLQ